MEKDRDTDTGPRSGAIRPDREEFLASGREKGGFQEFGQYLRRERELRNVSLGEIAQTTRISPRYLAAIEEGRAENLPATPFVKGFLAAYARHIGLQPEEVLTYYDEVMQKPRGEEVQPSPPPAKGGRRLFWWLVVLLAAVLLAALTILAPRWSGMETAKAPQVKEIVPTPVEVPGTPASPPPQAEPAVTPPTPSGDSSTSAAGPGETPVPANGEGVELELDAGAKTWVYAVIDEQSVKDFFLQPGEKIKLRGMRAINLTLGNGGGVAIVFNGRPLGPIGKPGEVKRDILFSWDGQRGAQMSEAFSRRGGSVP